MYTATAFPAIERARARVEAAREVARRPDALPEATAALVEAEHDLAEAWENLRAYE